MRVFVKLTFVFYFSTIKMLILQAAREIANFSGTDIRNGLIDRHIGGIGFGRSSHGNNRLSKRNTRFRKSQLQCTVHTGFDDNGTHWICHADIFACNHEQTAAGRNEVSCFQQACKIMQCCIFIRAPDRFLQGGKKIIVDIITFVIAQGGPLGDASQLLCSDGFNTVCYRCR